MTKKREYKNNNPPNDPEILDIAGAMALLGVGRNTIYYLVERKKIPCRRVGKEYRFNRTRLLEWLRGDEN